MKIRKAKSKDAKGISNVLVQSYNIKDLKESISVFNNETKKNHNYIVAEDKGKIIGIVTWLMHGLPKHQLCELDRIAVLPEYRGKGVARQLFIALIKGKFNNFLVAEVLIGNNINLVMGSSYCIFHAL